MVIEGGEETLSGIFSCVIWNVFACSSTTKGDMAKWRPQLDLAHLIGLETPLTRFLIVVERGITGGEDVQGGIFCSQTLEMFWPSLQQPAELRTTGYYGWISQVRKVHIVPQKAF